MPGLPQIQYPDLATTYAKALQIRQMREARNAMEAAGQAMAQGDMGAARNALFQGGQFQEGMKLDAQLRARARQAHADQLAKQQRFNATIGNLAQLADTPEKWATAIQAAQKAGLNVDKYADFAMRDFVVAQAGMAGKVISEELKRRKMEAEIAKGDFAFTKYGIGNKRTGEIRPYPEGTGDKQTTLEMGKYEQQLRKEYAALTKNNRLLRDSIGRVRTGARMDSGAGDLAVVFGYMKILDPTSVVREGEFATAENTAGVPQKIVAIYNQILNGQRLTPAQRQNFVHAAEALSEEQQGRQQQMRGQFEDIAKQTGASPDRVILDYGEQAAQDQAPKPAPGFQQGRPRAVNPQTGEVIEYDAASGQWVPVQ